MRPRLHFVNLTIKCAALSPDVTRASVTYTFTPLSDAGQAQIAAIQSHHPSMVDAWAVLINRRLQSG